ncbi:MAG: OFA family MFS transporter [Pseudomonadota bacterium]
MQEKVMNRWLVVAGTLIIQISLGAVYIWSVFQAPLKEVFPTWTGSQVTYPANIVLAVFALAVIIAGRVQDKIGPRWVTTFGGLVLGAGLILARFTGDMAPSTALTWLIFTFSVLGGAGIGAAYVCPVATCIKWFPDKRGLTTGLAVAGFGAGAIFFAPLAKALISGGPYKLTILGLRLSLFDLPKVGIFNTFAVLGAIFLVAVVLGAQLLINPPVGWKPAGWNPPRPAAGSAARRADYNWHEMLATPQFYVIWLMYFFACAAGLQVIMKASPAMQSLFLGRFDAIAADQVSDAGAAGASLVAGIAVFNATGRIIWGKVSDALGRMLTLAGAFLLCALSLLFIDRSDASLTAFSYVVGFCFGGFLAIFPAITADYFGTKNLGVNYGFVFSAYGAGGLLGPQLAAYFMTNGKSFTYAAMEKGLACTKNFVCQSYHGAFLVAAVLCALGAALTFVVRAPRPKEQHS